MFCFFFHLHISLAVTDEDVQDWHFRYRNLVLSTWWRKHHISKMVREDLCINLVGTAITPMIDYHRSTHVHWDFNPTSYLERLNEDTFRSSWKYERNFRNTLLGIQLSQPEEIPLSKWNFHLQTYIVEGKASIVIRHLHASSCNSITSWQSQNEKCPHSFSGLKHRKLFWLSS